MTGPKDEACEPDPDRANRDAATLDDLAEAWITLWQNELTALAADPEIAAAWRQAFGLGTAWWGAAQAAPREPGGKPTDQSAAAPGAAAPGAAPGSGPGDALGGADAARLRIRIEELERRLATLERGAAGSGADRSKPRRRRPLA